MLHNLSGGDDYILDAVDSGDDNMESDLRLLESWWTRRDAEAFNEIVTRYSGLVFGACLRVLGNASEAEDVAQECFVRLAERRQDIRVSLGGWLHRTATRRALDMHRSKSRRRAREERYAKASESIKPPDDLAWQEIRALVDEAIDTLPEAQRIVIIAHFIERRTHQAIAEELGISRRTVINHIQQGIEQTRNTLARRGVVVAETALAALFGTRLVEAAPVALASELGRLALAGTAGKSVTSAGVIGGGLVMKKTLVGAVVAVVALLSAWFAMNQSPESPYSEEELETPIVQPELTSPSTPSTNRSVDTGQLAATLEATLGTAQTSTQADEPASEGAVVEGIVRNQAGAPVADATIHIAERPTQDDVLGKPPVAHTGIDGRFRAAHVNPEIRTIFADHPDYAPGWSGMKPVPDTTEQVEILLTQGGAIEGVVTSGGIPRANEFVGVWLDASSQDTRTDTNGRYRIDRVPSGEWMVGVILMDAEGVHARQSVVVSPGMVSHADFNLSAPVTELTGSITLRGKPVAGGYVHLLILTPQGFNEERRVPLDDAGNYTISRVPEGPAELAATAITIGNRHYFRRSAFGIVGSAPNVQDIDIQPGTAVVSGNVKLDIPATNGSVLLLEGEFDPAELSREAFLHIDSQKVGISQKPNDPYRFDELEPGTYTLLALIFPDETAMSTTIDPLSAALIDLKTVTLTDGEVVVVDLLPTPVP
jgi:RNA polymerase sigma-70 factor (ECF subfamily)